MQYERNRDVQTHSLDTRSTLRHSPVYGRWRSKHAVSAGLLTLAEDERPEANHLIEWSQNALQRHTLYKYGVDVS